MKGFAPISTSSQNSTTPLYRPGAHRPAALKVIKAPSTPDEEESELTKIINAVGRASITPKDNGDRKSISWCLSDEFAKNDPRRYKAIGPKPDTLKLARMKVSSVEEPVAQETSTNSKRPRNAKCPKQNHKSPEELPPAAPTPQHLKELPTPTFSPSVDRLMESQSD